MNYFEDIINEIEKNITEEMDVKALAQKANMSVYEFRRIFTFVTQISFAEYVRKRRLSLAALELYESGASITDLAIKYGYGSPSSFSRAFKEFHGIAPSEVLSGDNSFKLLTRITTEITTTGGNDISYSVFKKQGFTVSGFLGKSEMTDTECCENVWERFYESACADVLCGGKHEKLYAVYDNGSDFVNCYIGVIGGSPEVSDSIYIPKTEWACFKLDRTDDAYVNEFYNDILNQWFSSVDYVKNRGIPNIEVFPAEMSEDNFEWEIWIPIERKI